VQSSIALRKAGHILAVFCQMMRQADIMWGRDHASKFLELTHGKRTGEARRLLLFML